MKFFEFRQSRMISQIECACLLHVSRDWVRDKDPKPLTPYWARALDETLSNGPYGFIRPRYFYPPKDEEPIRFMPATVRRRLPLGSSYLSIEYFNPETLEIAQSRKDLIAFTKKYPAERLVILRRVIARGKAGLQVIAVAKPSWPPPRFDN